MFPHIPLSVIAKPVNRVIAVEPGQTYRTLGVKWWGEGAYERETIDGSQTAAKTLNLVRENDLIINKIWVRHGSIGIVPKGMDGCAGSGEFPTFELDRQQVEPRWLHWLARTPDFWQKCDALSQGTSGKNRIKPDRFLTIAVPLPPVVEQQRIVARIEELAAKINEAQRLATAARERTEQLCQSLIFTSKHSTLTPIRELVRWRDTDVAVDATEQYHFAGVYCFGRGVFSGQKKMGSEFAYSRLTRLRAGDFTYPKLMAWEGAFGIVPLECDGLVVSPEFPVFDVCTDKVLPEVLDTYFRTPTVWPLVSGISTGTNVRRRRLNPSDFLNYQIPLPPKSVQQQIRDVKRSTVEVETLARQRNSELDALLPSVLTIAFRGEL